MNDVPRPHDVWPVGFEPTTPATQRRCASRLRHGQMPPTYPGSPRPGAPDADRRPPRSRRVPPVSTRRPDRSRTTRIVDLTIGDEPGSWARVGFRVTDEGDHGRIDLGGPALRLVGAEEGRRGILTWTIAGSTAADPGTRAAAEDPPPSTLDGLPTALVGFDAHPEPTEPHPNGVTGLDHLVIATPDLDRTIRAIGRLGVPCRRVREAGSPDRPMRQGFFKFGPVTIEVVSDERGAGTDATVAPAAFWGLALDAADLDRLRTFVGPDACSEARPAVQPGRRIATLRHRMLDLSVRLAALDDHRTPDPTPSPTPRTGGSP